MHIRHEQLYRLHPTIIMPKSYPNRDFRVLSVIYRIYPCTNWSIFNVPMADITSWPIVEVLHYKVELKIAETHNEGRRNVPMH